MASLRGLAGALLAPASLIVLVSCGGHGGSSSSPAPPSAQTIAFASAGPITKTYGDAAFTNAASGGAGGGAITYSSNALGVATVNATTGQVTIVAAGTAIITANKAADAAYLSAFASYTLQVTTAAQSISFANAGPIAKTFGDAAFGNAAAGGAGTGAVRYSSSNVAVVTVDANTGGVNIVGTGSAVITASKAADGRYAAASATYTVQVAPAIQVISFPNAGPISKVFGDTAFANSVSGGAGTGAVSYSSSNVAVATVDANTGGVNIVGAGSAVITAYKAADGRYAAASATYTVQVAPAVQVISFANAGPIAKVFGDAAFTNLVSGGSGTGAISYSSGDPAVAAVDATTGHVSLVGTGSAVITASKAADSRYAAASATYTVQVAPAVQVISFPNAGPIAKVFGDAAFTNLVSGGSGTGAISYSSSDPTIATVEANTGIVSIVAAGSTQIRATKAADINYLAAQATYVLDVARSSQSVSFADPGPHGRTYGDAAFTIAAVAPGSGALSFATGNPGVATVHSTSGEVTIVGVGDTEITASKAGDANYEPAQASYRLIVARAPQTLTFADAGPVNRLVEDASFANAASGGGGDGAVSYVSSEPLVGTVDGAGLVTFGLEGTVTITATKAASANHLGAQATYELNVLSRPSAPFTAWVGLTDPAEVTLPAAAVGQNFARALSSNCAGPVSTSCMSVSSDTVTTTDVTDPVAGLGRTAQYWLQNGASSGRPVSVDARRFENALLTPVELDDQLWMIDDRGAKIWSSSDGRSWVLRSASLPWTSRFGASLVKFDDRLYLIGGWTPSMINNDVWRSEDGLNWTRVQPQAPFAVRQDAEVVVHDGRLWLIGGYNIDGHLYYNDVWSSSDGVSWTQVTENAAFAPRRYHRAVSMNGRLWVVGGSGTPDDRTTFGDVWSSADGVSWRAEPAPPFGARRNVATLVYRNRWYVAGGSDGLARNYGDVWWTEDGLQWHQPFSADGFPGTTYAYLIPFRGRVWLLGGFGSLRSTHDFYSTADFRTWRFEHTSVPFPPARPGRLVSFDGKLWIIAQTTNGSMNAWWSIDGDEWTQSTDATGIPARRGFTVAVNNGRLWIQGGYRGQDPFNRLNDVWFTADGQTWTQATDNAPFEPRWDHEMFAMNGKLFMVGGSVPGVGRRGDVWSSTDGANWTQVAEMAAFGERSGHRIVVFNGKAWLLGGGDQSGTPGTIWSSFDGVNWTLEGTDLPALGRTRHGAVVHGGRIWITGGELGGTFRRQGDTWYSSDGITWTQQLAGSPEFSERASHGFASHAGKLWIYGGDGVDLEIGSHDLFWSLEGTDWRYRYHNVIEIP